MLGMVCGSLWLAFIAPTTSSTSKDAKNITLSIDRNFSIYFNIKYHNMEKLLLDFPCYGDIRFYYGNKRGGRLFIKYRVLMY